MLDITKDTRSLTTFRRRSGEFLKQLRKSKRSRGTDGQGKSGLFEEFEGWHGTPR